MATVETPSRSAPPEQRLLLRGVDWPTYRGLMKLLGERHLRLAYDGENLELMTVSLLHDFLSRLLGRFLVVLTEEFGMPIRSAGSATLDREDLQRGLEPDECYYLLNEPVIRDKEEINLDVDPPPDLGMEIDISRSSLNRLAIYAALKVPEVWRFDGQDLFIYRLNNDGEYELADRSRYFPMIPIEEIAVFLRRRHEMDENSLVRLFRDWVREQIAKGR